MPSRGMTMAQVEARFGAPAERLDARGGQKRQWPTINRWVYPGFVVYFEKSRVIDAVAHKAAPNEVGPKPARSEEHTSELQSLMRISYAVFCLKKKKKNT